MIKRLFWGPTNDTSIQFFRYIFVGVAATVIDFGFLYLLTEYGKIFYLVSAVISFVAGMIANNLLSLNWVFSGRSSGKKWLDFVVFSLIAVIGLGLNVFLMWVFTEHFGFYYLLSKVFATALVFLWNFIARKYFVLQTAGQG
jgi:putative flippase GtrA